jgi:hypothetical protein
LSSSPFCNLSWKTCHINTFNFIGNFDFQRLHKRVLTTPYVPRICTWIWWSTAPTSPGTNEICPAPPHPFADPHCSTYWVSQPIVQLLPGQRIFWTLLPTPLLVTV